ncbi:MAG: hypothetical protein Q4Q07_04985 [Tissierellia bacterium]|nr:hypothetical protein [Tissierellia bacterium]
MNNKDKKIIILLFVLIITFSLFGIGVNADADDPLITLSYLNERLENLGSSTPVATGNLTVVELKPGQSLIGAAGTEMILRTGKATAIASENGGLADLTEGKDIPSGGKIIANHNILLPRSDGRGLKSVTKTIVIVRGTYKVE